VRLPLLPPARPRARPPPADRLPLPRRGLQAPPLPGSVWSHAPQPARPARRAAGGLQSPAAAGAARCGWQGNARWRWSDHTRDPCDPLQQLSSPPVRLNPHPTDYLARLPCARCDAGDYRALYEAKREDVAGKMARIAGKLKRTYRQVEQDKAARTTQVGTRPPPPDCMRGLSRIGHGWA